MVFSGRFVCLVLVGIVMLLPSAVMAQDFTFTKIVDTNTPIPGGVGNFTDFGRPVMRGGKTVFWGEGAGQGGIFLYEGDTLTKLVDIETVFPDVPGTLTGFESVSFDGETVAFFGMNGSVSPRPLAILTSNLEGTLSKVASPQTIDGVHWTFSSPLSNRSLVSIDSGRTAYIMKASERSIFVSMNDGVATQVINSSTTLDDGSSVGNYFSEVQITPNAIFANGQTSIYMWTGADDVVAVASEDTFIPGGVGVFSWFRRLAADHTNAAFFGIGRNQQGIRRIARL